ncbi:large subunit GTPase 1 protein [Dioscorea alata]|uniref:Large subunit GTPase 1 protein n=1 Tax=Dioscorea alata TaxID=55571 RepID=A0ACB7VM92_DIOAL|nr:large subunit GTPase 1 protein [Dioscorea alata]
MGGKKERSGGLGRALVRQHNQALQQAKDKGRALSLANRKVLESVTEISDIDAVLQHAEEAALLYSVDNPVASLIQLDGGGETSGLTAGERRDQQRQEEALHASSLRVPRRPPWNASMSVEELDANERQAFLIWRRGLAKLEENEKLVLTPFEKNLDIWRQLWRVLERSDLLVMVVDARDPLFYRCPDLEAYAREIDEHKKTLLLVNKADLLPLSVRQRWARYFQLHGILFVFWSAKAASASLEGKKLNHHWEDEKFSQEATPDTKIYDRTELLARLQAEAEAIVANRMASNDQESEQDDCSEPGTVQPTLKHVVVGFVGYPNVGKSSTINALVGEKRAGVTSTPGKTKHFQTLIISDELILCDCPGLVFPSFSSSRYEMIASGVLPVDRMTEHRQAIQVVADRVPRHALESIYNITLPKPKPYESQSRPPTSSELLRAYCASRGHVGSSGLPDETRAARQILKDYIDGKLPHYEMPPDGQSNDDNSLLAGVTPSFEDHESHDSDDNEHETSISFENGTDVPDINHVLNDLESFDMASSLSSKNAAAVKKKNTASAHKHHKKPQRKKDRSWRVGNDNGDGMPVVRVFQKPAVNFEAIKASI